MILRMNVPAIGRSARSEEATFFRRVGVRTNRLKRIIDRGQINSTADCCTRENRGRMLRLYEGKEKPGEMPS